MRFLKPGDPSVVDWLLRRLKSVVDRVSLRFNDPAALTCFAMLQHGVETILVLYFDSADSSLS